MSQAQDPRLAFRSDIEGLRAVAVGLVVIFHAGVPWLPGGYVGVDVFFVVSGFLMTSLIVREIDATGSVSLRAFYARRIRRLLPAAVLVLVATLVAAKLFLPPLALPVIASAGTATALYGANLWLAFDGTDYLADDGPSPFQHYWSLAVEEQFYLGWPLLLLIAFRLTRGRWPVIGWGLGLLSAASLLLCVVLTPISQPWAFFSLPTRGWELAVGGLVALAAIRLRALPDAVARVVGWAGMGLLVASALLFTEETLFPGWAAAVPVAGSAAVLLAGQRRVRGSTDVLLVPRPMQFVGRLSYSIYLWHWPVLVLPAMHYGEVAPQATAALVVLAVLLAWLTTRLVEDPVRRSVWWRLGMRRTYVMGAAVTAVAVTAAGLVGVLPRLATDIQVAPLTVAAAGRPVPVPTVVPANVAPPLVSVTDDYPEIYDDGCHASLTAVTPGDCVYGQANASRSILLTGDSHAGQWFPAVERLATEDGWRLTSLTKSSCPSVDILVPSSALHRPYVECRDWVDAVVERARVERPDVVMLGNWSISYLEQMGPDAVPRWIEGLDGFIERLPADTQVVLLGDSPTWEQAPVDCLSENLRAPATCARPAGELVDDEIHAREAALAGGRVTYVPTSPWLCGDVCQAIDRNVVMYRDYHHVSATMSALLVQRIRAAVPAIVRPHA